MKKLAIISGANSQLAEQYTNHFTKEGTDVIATYKNTSIAPSASLFPVRADLQNTIETQEALWKAFDKKNLVEYAKIYFLHLVGGFQYEGLQPQQSIFEETYKSNVLTFDNVYYALLSYLNGKKSFHDKEITLFNIGSLTDRKEGDAPWFSYSRVKNILRLKMRHQSELYENVNGLFINAGTIDMDKEKILRPYAQQQFWLSREELFAQTIDALLSAKGYREKEVYKAHPNYEQIFALERLVDTHTRWQKEMGE